MLNISTERLAAMRTPFYRYDMRLLADTIQEIRRHTDGTPIKVHYAIKANSEPEILRAVRAAGFGVDCVSGGEVAAAIEAGFDPAGIFYAGVGKTDAEIEMALRSGIGCFNVESVEELDIISGIASRIGLRAPIALRVNPDIDAHTHKCITTGLEENKFGIDMRLLDKAVAKARASEALNLRGLHFHIGSQITVNEPYMLLCDRINALTEHLAAEGFVPEFINVGGGIGIDYESPDRHPIADFKGFFDAVKSRLRLAPGQELHCEPGRAVVGQCGSLVARVLYVKEGIGRRFAILDAGMTDLMRPALYGAHHKIELVGPADGRRMMRYDVVGPVCESTDVFGKDELLPELRRGDFVALRSAGAYGISMASTYNMRALPGAMFDYAD